MRFRLTATRMLQYTPPLSLFHWCFYSPYTVRASTFVHFTRETLIRIMSPKCKILRTPNRMEFTPFTEHPFGRLFEDIEHWCPEPTFGLGVVYHILLR